MRRYVLFVLVFVGVLVPASAAAAIVIDPAPIGPNQHFAGLVNQHPARAQILMACAGPMATGHPVAGQTVEVIPPVTTTVDGYTGQANTILAVAVTASPVVPFAIIPLAKITYYGISAAIPTVVTLPCGGLGLVAFVPVNGGPTAKPSLVWVNFVSLGV